MPGRLILIKRRIIMAEFIRRSANPAVEIKEAETVAETVVEQVIPTNSFVMVKNYRGGFGVSLEPWDFSAPARLIRFRFDQEKQHVPTK